MHLPAEKALAVVVSGEQPAALRPHEEAGAGYEPLARQGAVEQQIGEEEGGVVLVFHPGKAAAGAPFHRTDGARRRQTGLGQRPAGRRDGLPVALQQRREPRVPAQGGSPVGMQGLGLLQACAQER